MADLGSHASCFLEIHMDRSLLLESQVLKSLEIGNYEIIWNKDFWYSFRPSKSPYSDSLALNHAPSSLFGRQGECLFFG